MLCRTETQTQTLGVRRQFFGSRVELNLLVHLKRGLCAEDRAHCSQRRGPAAAVLTGSWTSQTPEADTTGRGLSDRDVTRVTDAIKEGRQDVEVCVAEAVRLIADAGTVLDGLGEQPLLPARKRARRRSARDNLRPQVGPWIRGEGSCW